MHQVFWRFEPVHMVILLRRSLAAGNSSLNRAWMSLDVTSLQHIMKLIPPGPTETSFETTTRLHHPPENAPYRPINRIFTLLHSSMAHWRIEGCTVDDAAAVARNTSGAFWEEPMWMLQWRGDITQDFLTEQLIKLQPTRLLRERDTRRHQKAVDPDSGKLVGYARWLLPDGRTTTSASEPEWAEAQMPDVSADRRKALDAVAAGAWWGPRTDVDELDADNNTIRRRVASGRPYLGKFDITLSACRLKCIRSYRVI